MEVPKNELIEEIKKKAIEGVIGSVGLHAELSRSTRQQVKKRTMKGMRNNVDYETSSKL